MPEIDQKRFFGKYNIDTKEFNSLNLPWKDLIDIANDHTSRASQLEISARTVVDILARCKAVHSIRWRIKNSEHLIEKIIRKVKENPDRKITIDNYRTEITDLLGIRALHLIKSDWMDIHAMIESTWARIEGQTPVAYIREGDERQSYEEMGCDVKVHKRDYRSVHYVITFSPTIEKQIVEIQVRTLFEEGWSEIDHRVAYPRSADDAILSGYLRIFNLLAGASDQMATYIGHLQREVNKLRADAENKDEEAQQAIANLEKIQKQLGTERTEKKQLEQIVDSLKRSAANSASTIGNLSTLLSTTSNASGHPTSFTVTPLTSSLSSAAIYGVIAGNACTKCGKSIPATQNVLASCPFCGAYNFRS